MKCGHGHWQKGWHREGGPSPFDTFKKLRRDGARGKISGVCAGIANYWDIKVKWVRIAAVLGLIFLPMPILIAYGLATFFIKAEELPPQTASQAEPAEPTAGASRYQDLPPDLSFPTLRAKFKELEERAGAMEAQVTSQEFHLRRDFRQMGEA
ncbi:PspC domain-containing protein [Dongia sp.]|uniref:PspC domain-containing protein n=1 Tax=Dongia sp. TaxID=1977262 RepID=UPI0035B4901E